MGPFVAGQTTSAIPPSRLLLGHCGFVHTRVGMTVAATSVMPPSTRRGTIRTGAPHIWQGGSLLALLMLGDATRLDRSACAFPEQ